MVLAPTMSRISGVDQSVVPFAVPTVPAPADQVTCTTPTLSRAVPRSTMVCAEVLKVAVAGDVMASTGATVSRAGGTGTLGPGAGAGVDDGGCGGGGPGAPGVGAGEGDGKDGGCGGGGGVPGPASRLAYNSRIEAMSSGDSAVTRR